MVQREIHGGSFAYSTVRPYAAFVAFDYALDYSESHPCSLKFLIAMYR